MLNGFWAILTGLAGISLLFICWRKQHPKNYLILLCGWILLLVSLIFWVNFSGIEFGIVFGLMMPAFYAWTLTLLTSNIKQTNRTRLQPYQSKLPTLQKVLRNGGWFLLVIPGLSLSSTLTTVAFTYLLPIQEINRMASSALLMPLVWGSAIAWLLIDKRVLRPLLINGTVGLCSAFYLFL